MLSYMVPSVEDKPPPVPKGHLQLELQDQQVPMTNGHPKKIIKTQSKTSTISAESSASSLSSVLSEVPGTHISTPNQDKAKHKLVANGIGKHPNLKRVSFGSSKGSMVETLIYESPLQEEPEVLSPSADQASVDSYLGSDSSKASKVRVTFFESSKPIVISSPEPGEFIDDLDASLNMATTVMDTHAYTRQASTDSGWDNPFRPDGDLSREADEIVELIKGGKPITPTPANDDSPKLPDVSNGKNGKIPSPVKVSESMTGNGVNGTKSLSNNDKGGQVELQRATVQPTDGSQVEHVNLKKKPKCECCVIQ